MGWCTSMLMIPTVGMGLGPLTCRVSLNGARAEAPVDVADSCADASAAGGPVLTAGRSALARAVASRLGTSRDASVKVLVCALPFEEWKDGSVVQQVRDSLRGTSTYPFNEGEPLEITINDVQVIPDVAAALVAQTYRLDGDERITVAGADLLDQVVGVVNVGRSVTVQVYSKGLLPTERFSRVSPPAADVARQVVALIGEYRNLLNMKSFVVAGDGAAAIATAVQSAVPGALVPVEPEWASAEGGRLFAAMRLRLLGQQGGGGQAHG